MTREMATESIQCPHCREAQAIKLCFTKVARQGLITLADFAGWVESPVVATLGEPYNGYVCDLYVCPKCGRVTATATKEGDAR